MYDMFDVYDNDDFNSVVEDVQCGIYSDCVHRWGTAMAALEHHGQLQPL